MAIGLNYADHIKETGQKTPPHQIWFTKAVTSINGPFDPIELPIASEQVDYEAELVVMIGKRCKHISKESAAGVVFGYCAGNDVSVRDWQMQTTQWCSGNPSTPTLRLGHGSSPQMNSAIHIAWASDAW
ncbi:MAG TPA: fumarylacetoacetate hydrolase family protein [Candidatus Binataceae bacterium]|jgi:2-keto-4-pentenoate hydratase/2-oxohepta-3-ene-1,7-dioic acid hydratase in catechol pathway